MAQQENETFSAWYNSEQTTEYGSELSRKVFEEAVRAFSTAVSKDPAKRKWLAESKHADTKEVLATVVGAKGEYEKRTGESRTRDILTGLSEKLHHYSAIADVLVQHHPEYTSLAWGAMKILFVGVVNHHKLVVQLASGLDQIADILPRADLLLKLYPNPELKRIVVEIHTQILRFLLRALGWYQESRPKHFVGSITRPVELRYDDLLKKIAALSNSLTSISSASSQAEQRDMHTAIRQQTQRQLQQHQTNQLSLHQLSELLQQVNERSLQTHETVLQMKESIASVAAEQVIHSSPRIELRQQISQVQLVQFLDQLSKTPLSDPDKVYRKALSLHKVSRAKLGSKATPFWLNPKIQNWNTSQECSLIVLKGKWDQTRQIRGFCVESIASLQRANISVIWALRSNAVASETTTTVGELRTNDTSSIDLIKYLIFQAVSINKAIHTDATLAPWLNTYLGARTEDEWLTLLASVLQGLPLLYIMLDLDVLGHSASTREQQDFWPPACQRMFSALSARGITTVVRVVLVNYRSTPSRKLSSGLQDITVHVGASTKGVLGVKTGRERLYGKGKMLDIRGLRKDKERRIN